MPRRRKQVQDHFPYTETDILSFDDIYIAINYVQLTEKECSFLVAVNDSTTMEHIFNDCNMSYIKSDNGGTIKYLLSPPPIKKVSEEAFTIRDDYDDEILEDGQCF